MKTNDIKKGDLVQLHNGWYAVMADNMKGNIRMLKVYGYETETGSVYAWDIKHKLTYCKAEIPHDIKCLVVAGSLCGGAYGPGIYSIEPVELTPSQAKAKGMQF